MMSSSAATRIVKPAPPMIVCRWGQVLVGHQEAVRADEAGKYVEAAGVGHPCRDVCRSQHVAVELNGEMAGLIVAHSH